MRYYLGIDGGGTKTDAALCDEFGRIAARTLGPAGNLVDIGMSAYAALLGQLLDGLAQQTAAACRRLRRRLPACLAALIPKLPRIAACCSGTACRIRRLSRAVTIGRACSPADCTARMAVC